MIHSSHAMEKMLMLFVKNGTGEPMPNTVCIGSFAWLQCVLKKKHRTENCDHTVTARKLGFICLSFCVRWDCKFWVYALPILLWWHNHYWEQTVRRELKEQIKWTTHQKERNLCAMSTKHHQVWHNAIWKSNWNICVRYFNVKYNYVRLWFECALNLLFERFFSSLISQFFFANWSRAPRTKNSKLLSSQRQLVASWKRMKERWK